MTAPAPPDISFARILDVQFGSSEPRFIIPHNNILYLTKVVWPFDPGFIAELNASNDPDKAAKIASIQAIQQLAQQGTVDTAIKVVTAQDLQGIVHGFAR